MAIGLIFRAFFRALGQMPDPKVLRITGFSVIAALVLLWVFALALFYGLAFLANWFDLYIPFVGPISPDARVIGIGSLVLALGASVFLMAPVASAISSLFLDNVAHLVEQRHYPHLPAAQGVQLGQALIDTVRFLGVIIAANLVALALYALLPPFAPLTFILLNGYLLGREYFQMAASRRIGSQGACELWRAQRATVWLAGALMVIPLTIPIVNLFVPVLGAATFTHLYQLVRQDPSY